MGGRRRTAVLAAALLLLAALASSCVRARVPASGTTPLHVDLAGDLAGLRTAFGEEGGKVRGIFIASPT